VSDRRGIVASVETIVDRAERFAVHAHGDQRYGDRPYRDHLAEVVAVLRRFGVDDPELLAAGWLHDVLEDTAATRAQLQERFGRRVTEAVWALTDGPGDDRAARKRVSYARIARSADAAVVKLADRIANCEAPKGMLDVYRAEHPAFLAAVRAGGGREDMIAHLRRLLLPASDGGRRPPP